MPTWKEIYKKEPIRNKQWIMPFGKYQGRTLEFIVEMEPQYILWLVDKTDLDFHSDIMDEIDGDLDRAYGDSLS